MMLWLFASFVKWLIARCLYRLECVMVVGLWCFGCCVLISFMIFCHVSRSTVYGNTSVHTCRFEAALARAIFHFAHLARIVDVAILAVHLAVRVFRLDFEALVGALVAVRVRAVLVVPIDLLQNRHRRRVLLLLLLLLELLAGGANDGECHRHRDDHHKSRFGGLKAVRQQSVCISVTARCESNIVSHVMCASASAC